MLLFSVENYLSTKTQIIVIYKETNKTSKRRKLARLEFLPTIVNLNVLDGRGLPA